MIKLFRNIRKSLLNEGLIIGANYKASISEISISEIQGLLREYILNTKLSGTLEVTRSRNKPMKLTKKIEAEILYVMDDYWSSILT